MQYILFYSCHKEAYLPGKQKKNGKGWTVCKFIVYHLHWVAASTPDGDGERMLFKWLSLLNHIANIHHGHDNLIVKLNHQIKMLEPVCLFPACVHIPLMTEESFGFHHVCLWFALFLVMPEINI